MIYDLFRLIAQDGTDGRLVRAYKRFISYFVRKDRLTRLSFPSRNTQRAAGAPLESIHLLEELGELDHLPLAVSQLVEK